MSTMQEARPAEINANLDTDESIAAIESTLPLAP